jgi:hypothetical protein
VPLVRPATVQEVAGEMTVHASSTLSPVAALIAVTVKLVGRPPVPAPAPTSIDDRAARCGQRLRLGASGAVGSQTAISVVFAIAVKDCRRLDRGRYR